MREYKFLKLIQSRIIHIEIIFMSIFFLENFYIIVFLLLIFTQVCIFLFFRNVRNWYITYTKHKWKAVETSQNSFF